MKKVVLVGSLIVGLSSGLFASGFSSSIKSEKPSGSSITKAKRALVWCTNNLQKIQEGKIWPNQVEMAVDKYYSKRKGLENLPNLMNYVPDAKKREVPSLPGTGYKNIFDGLTYGEIIRMCDAEMIGAKNKYFDKQFKPSNIAEHKIATYYEQEVREAMIKEQEVGKTKGYNGVFYGLIDSLTDMKNGKFTGKELSKFLIKPSKYDDYWRLTNIKDEYVAYEMFSGEPLMIIVKRESNKEYVDMAKLHNVYYKLVGLIPSKVSYNGNVIDTVLPALEIVK